MYILHTIDDIIPYKYRQNRISSIKYYSEAKRLLRIMMEKLTKLGKKVTHKTNKKNNLKYHNSVYDDDFAVSSILDKKIDEGIPLYRIRWVGFPDSQCTWESIEHLSNVLDMVIDFEKNLETRSMNSTLVESNSSTRKKRSKKASRYSSFTKYIKAPKRIVSEEQDSNDSSNSEFTYTQLATKAEQGSFELDIPDKIVGARKEGNKVVCVLSWIPGYNGIVPANSKYSSDDLKDYNPDLLLDFYEARLTFSY